MDAILAGAASMAEHIEGIAALLRAFLSRVGAHLDGSGGQATIDGDAVAGDPAAAVRGEEPDDVGDVFGLTDPAHRRP
ncbi:MAG: hypothetical protein QOE41_4707, partial [Mycobacterium sp.]|nr:hypothetical protein [Mycobacterium sp.]MDT5135396.1 hypothetical protein [Mycobacterium sp.]